jgi:RND family efflux transporter MFP subunit
MKPPSSVTPRARRRAAALRTIVMLACACGAGCRAKATDALPPASGEGAPPAPKVPTLAEIEQSMPAPTAALTTDRAGVGSLQPIREAALGPKETGIITHIAVDEGDRVAKGQLLFRLDSVQFELAVAQAKAASSAAKVAFDSARLDLERTQALRDRNSIAQDLLDQAKTRMDAAASAVEQARAALSLSQRKAANMAVHAPIAGVVTERRMNVGETATLMPPSIVLVIQDLDVLELRARLPEAALRTVHEGSDVVVAFPAIDEKRMVKVKRIAPTIDARTRTIEIVAQLPNEDHRLKSGMLAEVAYASTAGPAPAKKTPKQDAGAASAAAEESDGDGADEAR